ncbi:PilZ domain-containing protein [Lichenihabitans sp. Uapishka_5]|uniref:PilZ domain-containing protein n=1 Tax=Lichenihabitans sp. Uapishka_5 TaxID=3037302 RepID=UPI0029E7FF6D|nr:PilZ domain-containing protein [Lichenihabitans sp. Uapishka_5]MDX7949703.1 PilZ domain-containing protein [Lichenihabitans sp. Uapishka_5]
MTPQRKLDHRPEERRRHQRVGVVLLGRYMLADRQEYPCQSIDMSPGGLALVAPVLGEVGERVVCYLEQIGRVEGTVARQFSHGFALGFSVPLIKREKWADQLTWLANRQALGLPEDRRHGRIVPKHLRTTLRMDDGTEMAVRLLDISISGAAIIADQRPPLGSIVMLGSTPGRVVRAFGNGVGIQFTVPLPADQFGEDLIL